MKGENWSADPTWDLGSLARLFGGGEVFDEVANVLLGEQLTESFGHP
jgi:hypothetical protein